jgi:myo-inositol-1(or 4)-monophosphatase
LNLETEASAVEARDLLVAAAREAGALALGYFRPGARTSAEVQSKAGGSPVTAADLAADTLLKDQLGRAFPEAGWLSEETADTDERLGRRSLIVVDPIDGTRAFVAGDSRWAVSAALIRDGRPVAGVVHAPALNETWAAARGAGATLNNSPLAAATRFAPGAFTAAGPRPILTGMASVLAASVEIVPKVPSLAYRLCLAASGQLDFAVAAADSHDWDIAAADLILEEAGARLVGVSGETLAYNRAHVRRKALLARPEGLAPRLLDAFRAAIGG